MIFLLKGYKMKIFYILLVLIFSVSGSAWSGSKSPDKGKNQPVKAVDKSASGSVKEVSESKKTAPVFVDENGDGINDTIENMGAKTAAQSKIQKKDRFMDKDKDGINDGRGFHRERRRRGGQWEKGEGGKGKGGKGKGGPN